MGNLISTTGDNTPFDSEGLSLTLDSTVKEGFKAKIAEMESVQDQNLTDTTPIYWEARKGDVLKGIFIGYKLINKKDEEGKTEEQRPIAMFFDGNREVCAGQISIIDGMRSAQQGDYYRITCTEATAKKAKKFTILKG